MLTEDVPGRAGQRDLRLDFLRGLALVIVLIDHVEGMNGVEFVIRWMPISLGFSDAAEAFVFLSGLVYALASASRLQREGFAGVGKRTLLRSGQIWAGYVLTTCVVLGFASLTKITTPYVFRSTPGTNTGMSAILATVTLSLNFQFPIHNILSMYAVILPAMAIVLVVMRRSRIAGLGLSLNLWIYAQIWPDFTFPAWPEPDRWYFNPMAWQFLFAIGMAAGMSSFRFLDRRPARPIVLTASALVLCIGFLSMQSESDATAPGNWLLAIPDSNWLTDKSRLAPLRIVHFLAVAVVLRTLLSGRSRIFHTSRIARSIIRLGQASLVTYCVGVVLAFASVVVVQHFGSGNVVMAFVHLDNVLLSIVCASLWLRVTARNASRPTTQADNRPPA